MDVIRQRLVIANGSVGGFKSADVTNITSNQIGNGGERQAVVIARLDRIVRAEQASGRIFFSGKALIRAYVVRRLNIDRFVTRSYG